MKIRHSLFFALVTWHLSLFTAFGQHAGPPDIYPDPKLTPGVTNPEVTQATIKSTICEPGFTSTIRPSVTYTDKIKIEQMVAYGNTVPQPSLRDEDGKVDVTKCVPHSRDLRCYELDHLISLEIGGCASCRENLWPEAYWPKPGAHEKDQVENFLHRQVCSGQLTLKQAQKAITGDWYVVYKAVTSDK